MDTNNEGSQVSETEPKDNYEAAIKAQDDFVAQQMAGKVLIKDGERPWQKTKHGKLKYIIIPNIYKDSVLPFWRVFCNEIVAKGGKHRHQGGVSIFILEGRGYTIADGERVDWEAGDLIVLPIKPNGVEHQHFNLSDKPSRWVAFVFLPYGNHIGLHLTQIETV